MMRQDHSVFSGLSGIQVQKKNQSPSKPIDQQYAYQAAAQDIRSQQLRKIASNESHIDQIQSKKEVKKNFPYVTNMHSFSKLSQEPKNLSQINYNHQPYNKPADNMQEIPKVL